MAANRPEPRFAAQSRKTGPTPIRQRRGQFPDPDLSVDPVGHSIGMAVGAEGERAQRPVRCGVAVAAGDGDTGTGQPLLRPEDVHDPLSC
jgi:hypothetical protein